MKSLNEIIIPLKKGSEEFQNGLLVGARAVDKEYGDAIESMLNELELPDHILAQELEPWEFIRAALAIQRVRLLSEHNFLVREQTGSKEASDKTCGGAEEN